MKLFTIHDSLETIINNPRMKKLPLLINSVYYENIRPPFSLRPLKNLQRTAATSWGSPFPAEAIVDCANMILERREKGELITIPLWKDKEKGVLIPFLSKSGGRNPAVIILPGGGYERVSCHREGYPVAEELLSMGINAFVLNYRCGEGCCSRPLEDAVRAIRFLRANHEKLNVDPDNITLMGFSAGGHLAAVTAYLNSEIKSETDRYEGISGRPDKLCLCYPVISFTKHISDITTRGLLGKNPHGELLRRFSAEMHVDEDYPKTYIWCCADDNIVDPRNTELMDTALSVKGIKHMRRVFPSGGHAIALGKGTSAEGWLKEAVRFLIRD